MKKKLKKIARADRRGEKNRNRQEYKRKQRIERNSGTGLDCPFDVDMNNMYGTCHCNHENYESCCGDI